jgi:dTDP-glucose 4,6-dehydratase
MYIEIFQSYILNIFNLNTIYITNEMIKNVLVTGGCGFIGSSFVNKLIKTNQYNVYNLDCLNYCSSLNNIEEASNPMYKFINGNITNKDLVTNILNTCKIDIIVHFAAQSHVDTSFSNPLAYTVDNVFGTHVLLECAKDYGKISLFVHISTDEVYGDIGDTKKNETSVLCPTNPYSATKAAAELLVKSYYHSFKIPVIITRSNNVYGPKQYIEKVIPRFITQLMNNQALTIHGSGINKRSFVYIDDVVDAIQLIMENGKLGDIYNIGSDDELSVLDLAHNLITKMSSVEASSLIYEEDRPYNDKRYFICDKKLRDLGWKQTVDFDSGLNKTIEWYKKYGHNHWKM